MENPSKKNSPLPAGGYPTAPMPPTHRDDLPTRCRREQSRMSLPAIPVLVRVQGEGPDRTLSGQMRDASINGMGAFLPEGVDKGVLIHLELHSSAGRSVQQGARVLWTRTQPGMNLWLIGCRWEDLEVGAQPRQVAEMLALLRRFLIDPKGFRVVQLFTHAVSDELKRSDASE